MRLQMRDCSQAERAAFARWREASPVHATAYAEVQALFQQASLAAASDPRLQAAARDARLRVAGRRRRRRILLRTVPLAGVALLLVALGVGWRYWDPAEPERAYATARGERRTLELEDGSRVLLDVDSAVAVRYSRLRRGLVLERGRAQFQVARQPRRPFVVQAGAGEVRALGTRFQVRRYAQGTEVTLLQGRVEVGELPTAGRARRVATLEPGERLDFGVGGLWRRQSADLEVAAGWPEGQLLFRDSPLPDVVQAFNRYNAVQLKLGDSALDAVRISGQFYGNDLDSLILALEHGWSLRVERPAPDEVVLRSGSR